VQLDIDREAIDYIRRKGGVFAIVETYPHQNSYAEIPIPQREYRKPSEVRRYEVFEREGVTLYIGKNLFFKRDTVVVRLGRFLCFRWLELPTLTMFNSYD
jgi:hypothetical protein